MLSQALKKQLRSLATVKGRREQKRFLAEGTRLVEELLPLMRCRLILATPEWLEGHPLPRDTEYAAVSAKEIQQISQMKAPQPVVAVFDIPQHHFTPESLESRLSIALDKVQDPGNLGTIIRIADWFGISDIVCSRDTADAFNPKVVQASMGAIGRVRIHYVDLPSTLAALDGIPVYGTFLDGEDIYRAHLTPSGIIVMGNEGNGISPEVERHVSSRLLIPSYPAGASRIESLNVGVATAITVAEFRRRTLN